MPRKRLKLNIPADTTLCPQCDGKGCLMCGGKGYYDAHLARQAPNPPPKPIRACGACGETVWWWREPRMILESYSPGEWLCAKCHPKPK